MTNTIDLYGFFSFYIQRAFKSWCGPGAAFAELGIKNLSGVPIDARFCDSMISSVIADFCNLWNIDRMDAGNEIFTP